MSEKTNVKSAKRGTRTLHSLVRFFREDLKFWLAIALILGMIVLALAWPVLKLVAIVKFIFM